MLAYFDVLTHVLNLPRSTPKIAESDLTHLGVLAFEKVGRIPADSFKDVDRRDLPDRRRRKPAARPSVPAGEIVEAFPGRSPGDIGLK